MVSSTPSLWSYIQPHWCGYFMKGFIMNDFSLVLHGRSSMSLDSFIARSKRLSNDDPVLALGRRYPMLSTGDFSAVRVSEDDAVILKTFVSRLVDDAFDLSEAIAAIEDAYTGLATLISFDVNESNFCDESEKVRKEALSALTDIQAMIYRLVAVLAQSGADVSDLAEFACPVCNERGQAEQSAMVQAVAQAQKHAELEREYPRPEPSAK